MHNIHLIDQLTKRLTNPLPGHGFHPAQKIIKSNRTPPTPREKSFFKPAAVLILLFLKDHSIYFFLTKIMNIEVEMLQKAPSNDNGSN